MRTNGNHPIHILVDSFLLLLLLFVGVESSWYQGCFRPKDGIRNMLKIFNGSLPLCNRKCHELAAAYTGMQDFSCFCLPSMNHMESFSHRLCNKSCKEVPDSKLPCGGQDLWSVYDTSGPYIVDVGARQESKWLEVGLPVKLEVAARILSFVDIKKEPLIETEWQNTMEFVCRVGITAVSANVTVNRSREYTVCSLTFPHVGDFRIDVTARNLVSSKTNPIMVTVVAPKPRLLQVSPLNEPWTLPSCTPSLSDLDRTVQNSVRFLNQIPGWEDLPWEEKEREETGTGIHDDFDNIAEGGRMGERPRIMRHMEEINLSPMIAVFVNQTLKLEVSVATGVNLKFELLIWNGLSWEHFQHRPEDEGCGSPADCKQIEQHYVSRRVGFFPVRIRVHNDLGLVQTTITIASLDQDISHVTVRPVNLRSNVVPTHKILLFHLTSITALRQSTFIQADFGDGVVKEAAVRERQNRTRHDGDLPTLFASYGEGCNLSLGFDHVYEMQGVFRPLITLYNNYTRREVYSEIALIVLNQISGVRIRSNPVATRGHNVKFDLVFSSYSVNMTAIWMVVNEKGRIIENETFYSRSDTSAISLSAVFSEVGRYKIYTQVSNLLMVKKAFTYVIIQDQVAGLSLKCDRGQYIQVEDNIKCRAEISSGTAPTFLWDFQERKVFLKGIDKDDCRVSKDIICDSVNIDEGGSITLISHTFDQPGSYNITVTVSNEVNYEKITLPYTIEVQVPVGCLNVVTTAPTTPNTDFNIIATTSMGTGLTFDLDIDGQGRVKVYQEVEVIAEVTIFTVGRLFKEAGVYSVTVFAYNAISTTSGTVDIHVQEKLPPFSIRVLRTPLPSFRTLVVESLTGVILHSPNLLYQFSFADGQSHVTQVPVASLDIRSRLEASGLELRRIRGRHSLPVDVTVFNDADYASNKTKVEFKEKELRIGDSSSDKTSSDKEAKDKKDVKKRRAKRKKKKGRRRSKRPVLWHMTFVPVGKTTYFLLENKTSSATSVLVDYGDGSRDKVNCPGQSCNWDRRFENLGVFKLGLSFLGKGNNSNTASWRFRLQSVVVVEQPIAGLRIDGPADVEIECNYEWEAVLDSGSHVVFIWSLDGVEEQPTTIAKYITGFSHRSVHTLVVRAFNDINKTEASVTVRAKRPVKEISLSIPPTVLTRPTNINILVSAWGPQFNITCHFGDGKSRTLDSNFLSSLDENSDANNIPMPMEPEESGMKIRDRAWGDLQSTSEELHYYKASLQYIYSQPGEYNVTVEVHNGISVVQRSKKAVVEEGIGTISLRTNQGPAMSINEELVMTAEVSSGQNLQFYWDFSDNAPSTINSSGKTSAAIHAFGIPDVYVVKVTVTSPIESEGVTKTYSINVLEPVTKANVEHQAPVGGTQGAARLDQPGHGTHMQTSEVVFEAKSDGSSVSFTFDFGDGSKAVVDGVILMHLTTGTASHVYHQVGTYHVTLTASNALGGVTVSIAKPFVVQVPVTDLSLRAPSCVRFGQMASFQSSVAAGTNVSFRWKMDDQTELVDAGNIVLHQYRLIGKEMVQVTAVNLVSKLSDFAAVSVVEEITSVNLTVKNYLVVAGEPITYTAQVYPPLAAKEAWFNWEFPLVSKKLSQSQLNHTHAISGRHIVKVTVNNCLQTPESDVIEVHVVARLKGLNIDLPGNKVARSPVVMIAKYWQGDSMILTWNFGDGSAPVVVNNSLVESGGKPNITVIHTYQRLGEYVVTLHAENPVSRQEATKQIFILEQPCEPPEVKILGSRTTLKDRISQSEFSRSETIELEAKLTVNCTITSNVRFLWEVFEAVSGKKVIPKVPATWARENEMKYPTLILPPKSLDVGLYTFKLTVEMNGTSIPVYAKARTEVKVHRSPLYVHVNGGIYRTIGRSGKMRLDGSGSRDLDDADMELGFYWKCSPMVDPDDDCFVSMETLPSRNGSTWEFPASLLKLEYAEFLFNLSVWRLGDVGGQNKTGVDGNAKVSANQVVGIASDKEFVLPLTVECVQCWRNQINLHHKVSLRTHCHGCPEEGVRYKWEISLLLLQEREEKEDRDVYEYVGDPSICVNANGSTLMMMKKESEKNESEYSWVPLDVNKINNSSFKKQEDVRVPKTLKRPVLLTDDEKGTMINSDSRQEYSFGETREGPNYLPNPSEAESRGSRRQTMMDYIPVDIGEGGAGGSGRNMDGIIAEPKEQPSTGRDFSEAAGKISPSAVKPNPFSPSCADMCIAPTTLPSLPPPHLVSTDGLTLALRDDQTLTGLDQPSLVIKPGVLTQGNAYFVKVKAINKDGTTSTARAYFRVNRSPRKGRCSVRPLQGTPMDTLFSVFCNSWMDEHQPIRFEISYKIKGSPREGEPRVIYQGLRHDMQFQLPAGLRSHGYQVLLSITVLDGFLARTPICELPVRVRPPTAWNDAGGRQRPNGRNATSSSAHRNVADIMLFKETYSIREMAFHSVYNGIVPDLVALLRQVTSRLSEDQDQIATLHPESTLQRAATRYIVVETLKLLPLRNQVEVVEILGCLRDVINSTRELNEATILNALSLLNDITTQATVLLEASGQGINFDLDQNILNLVVDTVSSVMTALARSQTLFEQTGQREAFYKRISNEVTGLVEYMTALQLQVQSIGEVPIQATSPFLSVHASHLHIGQSKPVILENVQFHLPNTAVSLLEQWSSLQRNVDRENEVNANNDHKTNLSEDEIKDPKTNTKPGNPIDVLQQQTRRGMYDRYQEDGHCFQSRAICFQSDPYSLIPGHPGKVQTAVASLDLYSCDGSEQLKVKNLPQSSLVQIDIQRQQGNSSTFGSSSHYLNKTIMNIHELVMSGKNGHHVGPNDDPSRFLHIHINLESIPSDQLAFPLLVLISPMSVPHNIHNYIFKQVYNQSVRDIKIILPATSVKAHKSYSVGIAEASFNSGRRHSIEVKVQHYNFSAWWDTCVYWDTKEKIWRSEGCKVLETSSLQVLHCSCNHLTSFAGFYDLIPHVLTVVSVNEFFSPHENPLAVVIVGVILLGYIVVVLLMRPTVRSDDDAKRKGRVVFLQDNCASHRQKYEVVMETGIHPDAGTTSKVSLILHGDEGVSETRELTTRDNVSLFERNSRNRFIITLPETSGRIAKIQLWHNNSGSSPGWFLRQVIVRDLNSGLTFYFLCQKWLAVDRDDGKVEREFPCLDGSAMTFSQVFFYKGSQYLSDFHTWLSVLTCPPHSHFSRIQRLFLCLALLMSYMGLATLWFHFKPPVIRGEFGLLDLSWWNIVAGAVICCMMFPLNIIIAFLFRRSCVNTGVSRLLESSGGKPGLDLVSQGEDDMPQGSVPYSILDQSILNWQHIQEWAHKQWQKRQNHVISSTDAVKEAQNRQQQSSPSMIPLVQQTMLAGEEDTELGSSGFEDATSQATAERNRIIATSDSSSIGKKSGSEPSGRINAKRKLLLPWWCRYIAWVLCFLFIGAGTAVTVWYGFRFSHRRSVMWIQSVYFSLITCVFIVQPVVILLKALCTSIRHCHDPGVFDMDQDMEQDFDREWEERRKQEMNPWQEEDEIQQSLAARSRSRYLRFAGPLQEKQLKSSRRKMVQEKKALSLLRQGTFLTLLTLLVLVLAFGRNRSYQVHLNQAAHQTFAGNSRVKLSFMEINSLSDWYRWSRNVLVPSLSSMETLVNGKPTNSSSELGLIVGNVQLRQLRVKPQPCMSVRPLRTAQAKCFHDYSVNSEDSSYGGLGYWQFDETHPSTWGYLGLYGNTGSVLSISHKRFELLEQLNSLESSNWLDHKTRAVFVEMTLYNPPSHLFSSVTLLLEVSSSGKVLPSAHIRSSQLFHYVTLWEDFLLACELLLMIIVIVMFSGAVQKLFQQRRSFFSNFWNYIEVLMCLVSFMYILLFIYRFILVMEVVESLRSTFYEEFVSFAFLSLWDEILHTLLGMLLFFVLLKWLCVVSYNPTIARLLLAYKRSQREILLAAALFGGQLLAFSSLGHLLFGFVYQPMSSFVSTTMSVTALSVRILSSTEMADSWSIYFLSIFSVFAFVFLHGLVFVYVFSVMAYRLKRLKTKKRLSMSPKKLIQFYWHYLCRQTSSRKEIQTQEPENSLSPEFIMAEILYLVEELLFRMNNLLGTSGLPEKQHSFTDSDSSPDAGDDGISTGGSEEINNVQHCLEEESTEIMDLSRLEDRVHRIEDKLCSNEPYLAQLLKLDSFGTNILSEEEEQELRTQLEFEIFQQLQKQRQETTDLDCPNYCPQSKSKLESPKIITPTSNNESKEGPSPLTHKNTTNKNSKQVNTTETTPMTLSSLKAQPECISAELFPEVETKTSSKVHSTLPIMNSKSLKRSQSLKVPARDTLGIFDTSPALKKTWQGFQVEKDVESSNLQAKLLMNRHSSVKGKKEMMAIDRLIKKDPRLTTSILRKPAPRLGETVERVEKELVSLSHKMSSGNVSPQSSEGERGHKRTDSSSGQSGADTRLDTPKMVGKRLDLPPKPTFTYNSILNPPKVRPLDLMGEWTAAESSSGSEQEAGLASKRMCVGRRNLRKTKSRGKGKGNDVDIDSAIVLSEDFHSRSHRGISDCSIIIHPVPAHVDLDEISIPEEV